MTLVPSKDCHSWSCQFPHILEPSDAGQVSPHNGHAARLLSAHLYEYQPPRLLSEMLPTRALKLAITAGRSLDRSSACEPL